MTVTISLLPSVPVPDVARMEFIQVLVHVLVPVPTTVLLLLILVQVVAVVVAAV